MRKQIFPLIWSNRTLIWKVFCQVLQPETAESSLHLVKVEQLGTHLFLCRGALAASAAAQPTGPHASRTFWTKVCSSSPPPARPSCSSHCESKARRTGLRSLSSQVSRWDSCAADFCPWPLILFVKLQEWMSVRGPVEPRDGPEAPDQLQTTHSIQTNSWGAQNYVSVKTNKNLNFTENKNQFIWF